MSIKVFTAKDALKAILADPDKFLTILKKKESKTYKGGTRFYNAFFNIGSDIGKEGWFSINDVELSDGVADPANLNDKRNEFEGTRMQLQTTVSKAGDIGQFLLKLNEVWMDRITSMVKAGEIPGAATKKLHSIVQLKTSETHTTSPNETIADPIIRFKVSFENFPTKYPHKFLADKPKTQFYDYRTRTINKDGKEEFELATIQKSDGTKELVSADNLHLFATKGSIIKKGRCFFSGVAISGNYISMPLMINSAVILPGADGGFSDDFDIQQDTAAILNAMTITSATAAPVTVAVQPTTTAAPVTVAVQPTTTARAEEEDIDAVLNDL